MINANPPHRDIKIPRGRSPFRLAVHGSAKWLVGIGAGLLSLAATADAQQRVISEIGEETGLELYDTDAADMCILGFHQIRVTVNNMKAEGILKLEVFGEKNFMRSSGKLRKVRVPAKQGSQTVCIHVIQPGEYAVVAYHDQDADRRLDKHWNFRPKEPFALSNNPTIETLRLPKWEETNFYVPEGGVDITIDMVDPD